MDMLDSEKLIVELNRQNEIIDERLDEEAFSSRRMFKLLPETIVDKRTLEMLEIHDLFKAMNHTLTRVGSAHLFHSLMNPSDSIELIHAKHDSYCELAGNDRLKNAIIDFLGVFRAGEKAIFTLLNAHLLPLFPYGDFRAAMAAIRTMVKAAQHIPRPETVYLDSLVQSILNFGGSTIHDMAGGPIYRTLTGLVPKGKKRFFQPSLRFRAGRFSGGTIGPAAPGLFFGGAWLSGLMAPAHAESLFLATSWSSVLGIIYGMLIKPLFDYDTAILPARERMLESGKFASAIEAVAGIDELLSFITFSQAIPYPTVIPEVTNHKEHYFVAKDLRNPIMATDTKNFVGNDVTLEGAKLSFITGPNSGGKTTYCKTIAQNQLLGQIGGPVVASSARLNMTDHLIYQAPAFDTLHDLEGRFGTELKVTRDIFYTVTPKSLIVLDEIAEGTTSHEKMSLSMEILNGFLAIGNNTMMVTHSFELVENFRNRQLGQYLQVELADQQPTHRMINGISKDSHALRVAKKIGFSPADMRRHLQAQGYLPPEEEESLVGEI